MAGAHKKAPPSRHTPAFILLFLAQEESYGAALLDRMEREMPANRTDSAALYRSLRDLVESGAVEQSVKGDEVGPVRKWYRITQKGLADLREHRKEILNSYRNLGFFLDTFRALFGAED